LSLEFPRVNCEHIKEEDAIYIGDGQKIQQALHNIMRNAFQFESRAPGPGLVKVEAEMGEALIIKVYNRNSRIDVADRENVFKPFFSKKKGGRGIGLFIAARNVSLHGGEITTASDESGTTFIIKLPMTQDQGSKG
jgi:signal transduction histidine kinase